jgi:hypothetical protein
MTPSTIPPEPKPNAWRIIAAAGLVELALLAGLGWWPGATFPWAGLLIFAAAFTAYAVAATQVLHTQRGRLYIWGVAILMRLVLLPLTPELSDDIYRYLWDGQVQLAGINPYRYAPAAAELAEVTTVYQGLINNPGVHTIYPPLAQLAFLAIALVGGAIFQAKLLWLGLDLGTAWLLGRVASITGRSRRLTQLLYLWSPLLVVEVAWSGHMEPLGLFAMVLVILLARAPISAGAALALAALTKFAPAAVVPTLTRRLGWRFLVGFAATAGLLYAPYAMAGRSLFAGLGTYAEHWWFMKGPFTLLEAALPGAMAPRYAAGALVLVVIAWTMWQRYRPERALFWVLGAGMILTPTLHPWYVLWMLPIAALRASRTWILLTGLSFLGYFGLSSYQDTGVWSQPVLVRLLLWVPFLILLAIDAVEVWNERVPSPTALTARRGNARSAGGEERRQR